MLMDLDFLVDGIIICSAALASSWQWRRKRRRKRRERERVADCGSRGGTDNCTVRGRDRDKRDNTAVDFYNVL
jgi:hypothetical protein